MQQVHDEVKRNITASNESYKQHVDMHKRFVEFTQGNWQASVQNDYLQGLIKIKGHILEMQVHSKFSRSSTSMPMSSIYQPIQE